MFQSLCFVLLLLFFFNLKNIVSKSMSCFSFAYFLLGFLFLNVKLKANKRPLKDISIQKIKKKIKKKNRKKWKSSTKTVKTSYFFFFFFNHSEFSDYHLHIYCYIHNISADVSSDILQMYLFEVGSQVFVAASHQTRLDTRANPELRTTSFIQSTGSLYSDSVNHNWV